MLVCRFRIYPLEGAKARKTYLQKIQIYNKVNKKDFKCISFALNVTFYKMVTKKGTLDYKKKNIF